MLVLKIRIGIGQQVTVQWERVNQFAATIVLVSAIQFPAVITKFNQVIDVERVIECRHETQLGTETSLGVDPQFGAEWFFGDGLYRDYTGALPGPRPDLEIGADRLQSFYSLQRGLEISQIQNLVTEHESGGYFTVSGAAIGVDYGFNRTNQYADLDLTIADVLFQQVRPRGYVALLYYVI